MIKSFKSKALERIYRQDDASKVNASHRAKIIRILDRLDASKKANDMNLPGYRLHELKGKQKGTWAVLVSENWRITFKFEGEHAVDVDYMDYH